MRSVDHIALGLAATRAHLDDALVAVDRFGRDHGGQVPVDEALCQAIASLDEVYAQWSDLLEEQEIGAAVPPPDGPPAGAAPGSPGGPPVGPAALHRRRLAGLWRRRRRPPAPAGGVSPPAGAAVTD